MESAPDLEQPSAENSRGLSECLQRGSPDSLGLGSGSARSRHRSTTSVTSDVAFPGAATAAARSCDRRLVGLAALRSSL
ncbi:unnamed protein product [Schistocephalus solidus]|uniref:Uncharacterized protein n=1 Tax=Schistocephalus solidus TaxID=70667 RepID=A0A183TGK1_SCHSO|nr:unnamed protein product [Schistocephalus solidus]